MSPKRNTDLPPGYLTYRVVLIAAVLIVFIGFVITMASQVSPLAQWIIDIARAARMAWHNLNWKPF